MEILVKNTTRGPRAQSKDFKEVRNTHTEVNITQDNWDRTFHNWEEPLKCAGRKRPVGCAVCQAIDDYGFVIQHPKTDKETIHKYNVLIVGDIHLNFKQLRKLIAKYQDVYAVIAMGDLMLYNGLWEAEENKKQFELYEKEITSVIADLDHGLFKAFPIPVYVVKGNNDTYDKETIKEFKKYNIHYVTNGTTVQIHNTSFGILGGIYSPKSFHKNTSELSGREKRFYTKSEIETLKCKDMDVLLTHEAAMGLLPKDELPSKVDEGKRPIRELLDFVQPKLYIHAHHHIQYECDIEYKNTTTKAIGLGNFGHNTNAYVKLNSMSHQIYGTQ